MCKYACMLYKYACKLLLTHRMNVLLVLAYGIGDEKPQLLTHNSHLYMNKCSFISEVSSEIKI